MIRYIIIVIFAILIPILSYAQECFRNDIGLDPIRVIRSQEQINRALSLMQNITKPTMLTIGMSNTENVSKGFRTALKNNAFQINPDFRLFIGAYSGKDAYYWARIDATWTRLFNNRFVYWNLKKIDVNILFIMVTVAFPKILSPINNSYLFEIYVREILTRAEYEFPNLKLIYLTSNYFGGYDIGQDKTPEPYSYYEHTTIQRIQDNWTGNAQVIGIPIWTNGSKSRSWDGLSLNCPTDMALDGVHLNSVGTLKMGTWLLNTIKNDPTGIYFRRK